VDIAVCGEPCEAELSEDVPGAESAGGAECGHHGLLPRRLYWSLGHRSMTWAPSSTARATGCSQVATGTSKPSRWSAPPDACDASRSWHQLTEGEQCGEIDSARLTVVVASLTIRRPECPDPCSARPAGLPSLRVVPS
jgi:hypothetical protein